MRYRVLGLRKLLGQLEKLKKSRRYARAETIVGYGAEEPASRYAVYVHENAPIPPEKKDYTRRGSGPNFLGGPADEMRTTFSREVAELMASGKTMGQAIHMMGVKLRKESLKIVPVDTGALEESAVTRRVR